MNEIALWWYSAGFVELWRIVTVILYKIADFFSVDILIKTWLAPWRNDELGSTGMAAQDKLKILELNLAGRFVGATMRSFVILIALIAMAATSVFAVLALLVWLAMPFVVIGAFIMGIYLLSK